MDAIDRRILACLKENARSNATDIGTRINLSTSAVIERIKKLEASGIIKGYTANYTPVIVSGKCEFGKSVRVRITGVENDCCKGEILN